MNLEYSNWWLLACAVVALWLSQLSSSLCFIDMLGFRSSAIDGADSEGGSDVDVVHFWLPLVIGQGWLCGERALTGGGGVWWSFWAFPMATVACDTDGGWKRVSKSRGCTMSGLLTSFLRFLSFCWCFEYFSFISSLSGGDCRTKKGIFWCAHSVVWEARLRDVVMWSHCALLLAFWWLFLLLWFFRWIDNNITRAGIRCEGRWEEERN